MELKSRKNEDTVLSILEFGGFVNPKVVSNIKKSKIIEVVNPRCDVGIVLFLENGFTVALSVKVSHSCFPECELQRIEQVEASAIDSC